MFAIITITIIIIIITITISILILVILTCQRRKSLRRTSPEVRMSRSGWGELLLYKHSFNNDSETSLRHTREQSHERKFSSG